VTSATNFVFDKEYILLYYDAKLELVFAFP